MAMIIQSYNHTAHGLYRDDIVIIIDIAESTYDKRHRTQRYNTLSNQQVQSVKQATATVT